MRASYLRQIAQPFDARTPPLTPSRRWPMRVGEERPPAAVDASDPFPAVPQPPIAEAPPGESDRPMPVAVATSPSSAVATKAEMTGEVPRSALVQDTAAPEIAAPSFHAQPIPTERAIPEITAPQSAGRPRVQRKSAPPSAMLPRVQRKSAPQPQAHAVVATVSSPTQSPAVVPIQNSAGPWVSPAIVTREPLPQPAVVPSLAAPSNRPMAKAVAAPPLVSAPAPSHPRAEGLAAPSAPAATPPPSVVPPPQRPPAMPQRMRPNELPNTTVRIGSIEVRVTPPPAPPLPPPAASPARAADTPALSRGFASPFGLRQG